MAKNPWSNLEGENFKLENLGRPAVFLIPSHKLRQEIDGQTAEDLLRDFLLKEFGAFTTSFIPSFGVWTAQGNKKPVTDECRQYEVSFVGTDKIRLLVQKLADLCRAMKEDCFYFKAGEDTCLIRPH